jgi:hypothetical protein
VIIAICFSTFLVSLFHLGGYPAMNQGIAMMQPLSSSLNSFFIIAICTPERSIHHYLLLPSPDKGKNQIGHII